MQVSAERADQAVAKLAFQQSSAREPTLTFNNPHSDYRYHHGRLWMPSNGKETKVLFEGESLVCES